MEKDNILKSLKEITDEKSFNDFLKKLNFKNEEIRKLLSYLNQDDRKLEDQDLKYITGGVSFPKFNKNSLIFTGALFCALGGGYIAGKYINSPSEYDNRMKNIGRLFNNYMTKYERFMNNSPSEKTQNSVQYKMLRDFVYCGEYDVMNDEEYNDLCKMLSTTPNDYLNMKS